MHVVESIVFIVVMVMVMVENFRYMKGKFWFVMLGCNGYKDFNGVIGVVILGFGGMWR